MWKDNTPKHLVYDNISEDLSELGKLKKDYLAITDARCKFHIYNIIKTWEE